MAPQEQAVDPVARRRRWRRVRTSVTLLVLIGFVVGAAWYSWANVIDKSDDVAAPTTETTSCLPGKPKGAPGAGDIRLNVYNSTSQPGLAATIANQMRDHGFVVVDVANDPLDATIAGSAEIRANREHQLAATRVASLVPGAVFVPDTRTEGTVDLVLGAAFNGIGKPPNPKPTAPSELPRCEPVAR